MKSTKISINPIGIVRTQAIGGEVRNKSHLSKIHLNRDLLPALEGIKEFSHIFVLFWLHEISDSERKRMKIHPRGRTDMPLVGVFAARSKYRPNPIGLTLCELVSVEGTVLTVRGLDAYDGTCVLDLKPYDLWDCIPDAKVPTWWIQLERERIQRNDRINI